MTSNVVDPVDFSYFLMYNTPILHRRTIMAFQRSANMKSANMNDDHRYSARQLLDFFSKAKDSYFQHGCEDEVFVCDQLIEALRTGERLDPKMASRILGI